MPSDQGEQRRQKGGDVPETSDAVLACVLQFAESSCLKSAHCYSLELPQDPKPWTLMPMFGSLSC